MATAAAASPPKKVEEGATTITEVLPKAGLVYSEKSTLMEILCKPKIMPIKSLALIRLEQLEQETQAALESQAAAASSAASGGRPASRAGGAGAHRPTSARPMSAAGGRKR